MSPAAAVVLDNEAALALLDPNHPNHPKHRRLVALLTEANRRNLRRAGRIMLIVATAVRVEAGWARTDPAGANAHRLTRPRDHVLDTAAANRATQLRVAANVSVVDACVAEAAEAAPRLVAIATSDQGDMDHLAGLLTERQQVRSS